MQHPDCKHEDKTENKEPENLVSESDEETLRMKNFLNR